MSTTPELDRHIEQIVNSNMPRFKELCKELIETYNRNGENTTTYINMYCTHIYENNFKYILKKITSDILKNSVSHEIDSILDKMINNNKYVKYVNRINSLAKSMTNKFIDEYKNFLSTLENDPLSNKDTLSIYKSESYVKKLSIIIKTSFINVLHDIHKNEKKNIKSHYKTHRRHLSPIIEEDEMTINESSPIKGSGKKKKRKTRKNKKKSYYNGK